MLLYCQLDETPGATITALGQIFAASGRGGSGTASNIVAEAIKAGHVEQQTCRKNRRRRLNYLTENGKQQLRDWLAVIADLV
jgi:DNA-binding MarR family transcriptional regulator